MILQQTREWLCTFLLIIFLGEDWYVAMPEGDDQVITVAVAEILNKYPKNRFSAFVKKIWKLLKNKRKGEQK